MPEVLGPPVTPRDGQDVKRRYSERENYPTSWAGGFKTNYRLRVFLEECRLLEKLVSRPPVRQILETRLCTKMPCAK